MKILLVALAAMLAGIKTSHAVQSADGMQLQRLALCQESWHDWEDGDVRTTRFVSYLESHFDRSPQGDAFTPKFEAKVLGYAVTQVYPQSVGMGAGFSLLIDANFIQARGGIERQLDKPMTCLSSDGIRSCELKLGLKKTALLMTAQNGHANTSLIGCYYLFQK